MSSYYYFTRIPVATLSQEATYEYVFGGPLDSHALSSTLKLTSPPIRLRPDVYRSQSIDSQRSSGVDDGRSSSAQHSQHHRSSRASSLKRSGYIGNDGTASIGSRKSNRSDGEDEDSLRQLLIELQKQVSVMSMNLSAKLDDLQRGDRHFETTVALCEIRTQLQELTKSVESCQTEVSEVKRDMVQIKHELDTVQQVKEEIEELREYVDRLEEHTHRRKLRLLEQVSFQPLH